MPPDSICEESQRGIDGGKDLAQAQLEMASAREKACRALLEEYLEALYPTSEPSGSNIDTMEWSLGDKTPHHWGLGFSGKLFKGPKEKFLLSASTVYRSSAKRSAFLDLLQRSVQNLSRKMAICTPTISRSVGPNNLGRFGHRLPVRRGTGGLQNGLRFP